MGSPRLRIRRQLPGLATALGLALALIVLGPGARGQVPGESPSWSARVDAASPGELQSLVREMTRLADSGPVDAAFRRAYADATYASALDLEAAGSDAAAVEEAIALARSAAGRFGHDELRLRVEELVARRLADRGDPRAALRLLDGALEQFPGAIRTRTKVLLTTADFLRRLGEFEAALERAESVLHGVATTFGSSPAEAAIARRIRFEAEGLRGQIWLELGVPDLAATSFARCEELAREAPAQDAPIERLETGIQRAQIAFASADWRGEIGVLDEALVAEVSAVEPGLAALARALRAQAEAELVRDGTGDAGAARQHLETALASPDLAPEQRFQLEWCLADLALLAGDLAGAQSVAARLRERIGVPGQPDGSIASPRTQSMQARLEGDLALAARAPRAELEAARDGLAQTLGLLAEQWQRAPLRSGGVGFLYWGDRRTALSTLARLEMAIDPTPAGRERALDAVLRAQALGTLARQLGVSPVDVDGVRESVLAPGRGLLVVLPAMDRTHVFALDVDGIAHVEAGSRDALLRTFGDLIAEVNRRPDKAVDRDRREHRIAALARALGDEFLAGEVGTRVSAWQCVILSGAELLGDACFELLRPRGGLPLGVSHAVERATSLPLLCDLAKARPRLMADGLEIVLVANPEAAFAPSGIAREPVVLTPSELESVTAPFESARVLLKLGRDANPAVMQDECLSRARVLAFVTHGVFDAQRQRDGERPAGLALGPGPSSADGVVWCADVERCVAPDLVELFACGTERGPARLGDDTSTHLGSAFFAAGARVVVSSPSDLDLAWTLRLASVFNERLRTHGDAPAEAMRRARLALMEDPSTSDPRAWGLVRVHGLAHEPMFDPDAKRAASADGRGTNANWWLAGFAASSLAIAAALLAARSRRDRGDRGAG